MGKIYMRVIRGGLVPADVSTQEILRARGYRVGDILQADLSKLRNPGFHRLVHRIGQIVAENIDAFKGMNGHEAIKRLQLEGDIACEHRLLDLPGAGRCMVSVARSIAYDSMDEGEFREVARSICRVIADRYWPSMSAEDIEKMAEIMIDE